MDDFIKIGINIAKIINPVYGLIHDTNDAALKSKGRAVEISKRVPGVYWGNFFGKIFLDKIGLEKLNSINFFKKIEINSSLILIITSESPLNPEDPIAINNQKALADIIKAVL